jgi:hypothetical protein
VVYDPDSGQDDGAHMQFAIANPTVRTLSGATSASPIRYAASSGPRASR